MIRRTTPNTAGRNVNQGRIAAICWVSAFAVLSAAHGQLPTTQLGSLYPMGAKQGTSVDVTIAGATLDDVNQLVFSHEGIAAAQKTTEREFFTEPQPVANQFTVTIAPNVAPGVYEARAIGRFGASNPRAFVVSVDEELLDDGANKSTSAPRELKVGQTITGRIDGSSLDYFKLTLKAGERVLVDCLAERIDSQLDATLVCFDPNGLQIAMVRDTEGRDPVLDLTASVEGDYVVGLHDFLYDGGADYFYRLSVHSGPHIDFVFPPAGVPGTTADITVYGRNLPNGEAVQGLTVGGAPLQRMKTQINIPGDDSAIQQAPVGDHLPLSGIFLDGIEYQVNGSNRVRIGLASAPVVLEADGNDEPTKAQQVAAPCEIAGQFYPARDTDWYQFEAKAGTVLWLDVTSHQLGLETDPYLIVQRVTKNEQGEEQVADVAQVDDPASRNAQIGGDFDTSTDDPSYRLDVKEDSVYRVAVRDQFGASRNDPRMVYRLAIRPEKPGFRLIAYPEQPLNPNANVVSQFSAVLRKGGTTVLKTVLERRDSFDGEVQVSVEGLPAGVKCDGAVMSGAVNTAWLVLTADEGTADWTGTIRVVGKGKVSDQEVVRTARTGTCVWGTPNRQQSTPYFRVTRDVGLSVCKESDQAFVQAGDGSMIETARGAKLEIPVTITRRGEFKADMKLVANGLPGEIKPAELTVKGDAADGKVELVLNNAAAKPGVYTFVLRSDVQIKYARNPDAIARAEQEQKALEEAVKTTGEAVTKATADRDAAKKGADEAAAALKTATDAKTAADAALKAAGEAEKADAQKKLDEADKALTDATAKDDEAKKGLAAAETTLKEAMDKQKRATDAKSAADKNLDAVKKANAENNLNVAFISTPIKLNVAESPIGVALESPPAALKQGDKAELTVKLTKNFGFDENTDVTLELPGGVAGISLAKATIEKGQDTVKVELTAAANATVGDHMLTVRAKAKSNNVDVTAAQPLALKIEAAEAAK